MIPARVTVLPQLLSPSWTSLLSLRAILCLPGELRSISLRTFTSVVHQQQRRTTTATDDSSVSVSDGATAESSPGLDFTNGRSNKPDVDPESFHLRGAARNRAPKITRYFTAKDQRQDGRSRPLQHKFDLERTNHSYSEDNPKKWVFTALENNLVAPDKFLHASEALLVPEEMDPPAKHTTATSQLPMVWKTRASQPEVMKNLSPKSSKRDTGTFQDLVTQISTLKSLITEIASPKTSSRPEPSIFNGTKTPPVPPEVPDVTNRQALPIYKQSTELPLGTRSSASSVKLTLDDEQLGYQSVAHEPFLAPKSPIQSELPARPESQVSPESPYQPHSEISPAALLEELFPKDAERQRNQLHEEDEADTSVPRLPLPVEEQPISSVYRTATSISEETIQKDLRHSMTNKEVMTVLELQSGNTSLTADDFRRLTPKGKHMKEWAVRGEFKTVFPRRNPWTLARDPPGHYFIVFSNTASAHAYLDHLIHVQRLARQYTPTSLASPIPPPPGYLINGEDVHALIKDFTLICPAQTLNVSTYSIGPGFTKFKAQLFERGGYPEIVGEGQTKVPQVLLTMVAGPQPTYYELSDAIGKSGKDRNRAWQLVERPDRIRMIEMDRYARSHLYGKDEGGDYHERVAKLQKPEYGQRWVLTFLDWEDAKSFVRCWHQRPLPWKRRRVEEEENWRYGKQVTMVEAELLW